MCVGIVELNRQKPIVLKVIGTSLILSFSILTVCLAITKPYIRLDAMIEH